MTLARRRQLRREAMRGCPHPAPLPSLLKLIVLLFVLAASLVWLASQISSCTNAEASQVPDPTPEMTVEMLLARIIDDTRRIGEQLPPNDPRQGVATLRTGLGQNLCSLSYWLNGAGLPLHSEEGCEVLWAQWPAIAENCPGCGN